MLLLMVVVNPIQQQGCMEQPDEDDIPITLDSCIVVEWPWFIRYQSICRISPAKIQIRLRLYQLFAYALSSFK